MALLHRSTLSVVLLGFCSVSCKPRLESGASVKEVSSAPCEDVLADQNYSGETSLAAVPFDSRKVKPAPNVEHGDFYLGSRLDLRFLSDLRCQSAFKKTTATSTGSTAPLGFGLADKSADQKSPIPDYIDKDSYATRDSVAPDYSSIPAESSAVLFTDANNGQRWNAIKSISLANVMSAAGHLDLRDPKKVFFFSKMITVDAEKTTGKHSGEDVQLSQKILKVFTETKIVINVFAESRGAGVVVTHVECTDGNHRLAGGFVSGKWKSIADIPASMLEIRVNGERANDRGNLAQRDLHWLPEAIIHENPDFNANFHEVGPDRDIWSLKANEFFKVPASWGPSGATIAIRPEIPSSHQGMGKNKGVPLWKVVQRTLMRDGIARSEADFPRFNPQSDDPLGDLSDKDIEKEQIKVSETEIAQFEEKSRSELSNISREKAQIDASRPKVTGVELEKLNERVRILDEQKREIVERERERIRERASGK